MHVCKYRYLRGRGIGEYNGESFKGVSKTRKKHMKKLSFIFQFKIAQFYSLVVVEKCLKKCLVTKASLNGQDSKCQYYIQTLDSRI